MVVCVQYWLVSLIGIYDKHVQHSDLNSFHSVLTVEYRLKNVELNWSTVDLIEIISVLCQLYMVLGFHN